ncbi:hypothetical protein L915_01371, partial [Phytophthora nicotianae]
MTKSASRQKANNANGSKNATITSTANAPVNPAGTKSTNKNPNVAQNANANVNKAANKNFGKIIALTDVTPASVQQARQIRKTDFERFQKFHNFFIANEEPTARVINSKANTKREQVDQWLAGAVNPKTL